MTTQTESGAAWRVSDFLAAQFTGDLLEPHGRGATGENTEDAMLEVFVAHQDLATGVRAKKTLDRLCQRIKLAQCLHLHLWRFELLEDSILWREAASNASRADILFFSLHGDQPLPSGLCHWFKHWLLLRDERPCALVVSLDERERDSESGRNVVESLRSLAATGGIAAFPYFDPTPAEISFTSGTQSHWNSSAARRAAVRSADSLAARGDSPGDDLPGRPESCMADEDPIPLLAAGDADAVKRDWGLND